MKHSFEFPAPPHRAIHAENRELLRDYAGRKVRSEAAYRPGRLPALRALSQPGSSTGKRVG